LECQKGLANTVGHSETEQPGSGYTTRSQPVARRPKSILMHNTNMWPLSLVQMSQTLPERLVHCQLKCEFGRRHRRNCSSWNCVSGCAASICTVGRGRKSPITGSRPTSKSRWQINASERDICGANTRTHGDNGQRSQVQHCAQAIESGFQRRCAEPEMGR